VSILKVEDGPYTYKFVPVNEHCAWRVKTMFTKEPDTIEWLSQMKPGETLVDVGANIGIYTIFAAVRGVKVFAFEPEAMNYAILNQNLYVNGVDALAYCCALSDTDVLDGPEVSTLNLSMMMPGGSCHSFGEEVDHRLQERKSPFKQGCIGLPLSAFDIIPDYIKIDVDGFEHKVVSGASDDQISNNEWLDSGRVRGAKSVLIEINQNLPEHRDLVDTMLSWGFKYDQDQVEKARRKEGAFLNCGNYIFYK
jgi:FkbM family methyltransferase